MQLNDYQKAAMQTKDERANSLEYMTLGLAGEAGEVANKVKKILRGDKSFERTVEWYESRDYKMRVGGNGQWVLLTPTGVLIDAECSADVGGDYPNETDAWMHMYHNLELNYPPASFISQAAKDALKEEIGDALWYIAGLLDVLGVELEDAAQANLDKLAGRWQRGTIKGSGDKR